MGFFDKVLAKGNQGRKAANKAANALKGFFGREDSKVPSEPLDCKEYRDYKEKYPEPLTINNLSNFKKRKKDLDILLKKLLDIEYEGDNQKDNSSTIYTKKQISQLQGIPNISSTVQVELFNDIEKDALTKLESHFEKTSRLDSENRSSSTRRGVNPVDGAKKRTYLKEYHPIKESNPKVRAKKTTKGGVTKNLDTKKPKPLKSDLKEYPSRVSGNDFNNIYSENRLSLTRQGLNPVDGVKKITYPKEYHPIKESNPKVRAKKTTKGGVTKNLDTKNLKPLKSLIKSYLKEYPFYIIDYDFNNIDKLKQRIDSVNEMIVATKDFDGKSKEYIDLCRKWKKATRSPDIKNQKEIQKHESSLKNVFNRLLKEINKDNISDVKFLESLNNNLISSDDNSISSISIYTSGSKATKNWDFEVKDQKRAIKKIDRVEKKVDRVDGDAVSTLSDSSIGSDSSTVKTVYFTGRGLVCTGQHRQKLDNEQMLINRVKLKPKHLENYFAEYDQKDWIDKQAKILPVNNPSEIIR